MDLIDQAGQEFYKAGVPLEQAQQYTEMLTAQINEFRKQRLPPAEAMKQLEKLTFDHQDASGKRIKIAPFAVDIEKELDDVAGKRKVIQPPPPRKLTIKDYAGVLYNDAGDFANRMRDPAELANLGKRAASVAIPVVAGLAGRSLGAAGGALLGGVGAVPGAIAGDMAGSALGEWVNQKIGLTPESKNEIALAGAIPGVMSALSVPGRLGKEFIYKHFAGRPVANQVATDLSQEALLRGRSSAPLFKTLDASTYPVDTNRPFQTLQDFISDVKRAGSKGEIADVKKALDSKKNNFAELLGPKKVLGVSIPPAMETRDLMTRINRMREIANEPGTANIAQRALLGVRKSAVEAVEGSAQKAVDAFRIYNKEQTADALTGILSKPHPLNALETKLADDDVFAAAFKDDAAALDQIKGFAKKLEKFTASGSAGVAGRTITAAAGASIPGGATVKTVLAGVGAMAPEIVGFLAARPKGRAFLEKILKGESDFTVPKLATAAQFARALAAEESAP